MKLSTKVAALGAIAMAGALLPVAASADQQHKNDWRNAAIAGGAVALYGLHNHDTTTAVLGAAGTAYSLHRYEQDRHSQDEAARARARYHRLHHRARHHHD